MAQKSRCNEDCLQQKSNGFGLDAWICKVISHEPKLEFLYEGTGLSSEWIEWAEMWASDMTPNEALKEYYRVYFGDPHIQEYIEPANNTGY